MKEIFKIQTLEFLSNIYQQKIYADIHIYKKKIRWQNAKFFLAYNFKYSNHLSFF